MRSLIKTLLLLCRDWVHDSVPNPIHHLGSVEATITDQSGAALPGARVMFANNLSTHTSQKTAMG